MVLLPTPHVRIGHRAVGHLHAEGHWRDPGPLSDQQALCHRSRAQPQYLGGVGRVTGTPGEHTVPLLETRKLSKNFGGLHAIANLDFKLHQGEMRGLIGPNGSGKSTFFNLVSSVYAPTSGSILLDGQNVTALAPHKIAELGVARTFQLLRNFNEITVLDNLRVGQHMHVTYSPLAAILGTQKVRSEEKRIREEMMEILTFIGLADFAEIPASELSGGQRRLLSLGRAMAMRPKLLLLDEPAAGLSPVNVDNLLEIVAALQKRYDLTVVIVEHILKVVMNMCQRVTVLDHGEKIAEGTPQEVKDDHAVIEAYLGREMNNEDIRAALMA
ncbi:MAG: ABC transporter ATP-binding protein [Hyphomicrobiales bacterium]|nr:ABC transporter ATP-binding protein [Hyphomicrobiales bacterium]